jgi:dienelactone hydrolase
MRVCRNLTAAAIGFASLLANARVTAQTTPASARPLPAPTGPQGVGTTVAYLVDASRTDSDFRDGRPITLQLWYPAERGGERAAPYLIERGLADLLWQQQYYGVDSAALASWKDMRTHALLDAAPASGTHPLLAFSVGLGVARANYTSIVEELASYGYVVAVVESPLQGIMELPSGRAIIDTAGRYGDVAQHRMGATQWARDISFVLDRLRGSALSAAVAKVAAGIDWSRIGALGHSSGGLVAVQACENDARVRVCANMDGGVAAPDGKPLADFVARGVTKPTLFLRSQPIYDDTTLARRGMTREQWLKRNEAGRIALDTLASRSRGSLTSASVAGTGHFSFTDGPFVMPSTITRFGGRIIDAQRGWVVISGALRAFFDGELLGRGGGLAAMVSRAPELTVVQTPR